MNTTKLLRSKRVIVTTTAIAALAVTGGVWATAANADVPGAERDRVAAAAVAAVGGGTATDVDTSDDPGEAYEVEVRKSDGTEVDVTLDQNLKVISQQVDTPDTAARPDTAGAPDADDRVLTAAERASAEKAVLAAFAGGNVTDLEAGDDPGVAYEAEVRAADNTEWDVDLDAAFKILTKNADN